MGGFIAAGRIGKPYGQDGGMAISLYDTFPAVRDNGEPLFVMIDRLAVPLFIESFQRRGQSGAVVRFSDIDTPLRAEELSGLELFLKDNTAQDTGGQELYFEDLIGFTAILGSGLHGMVTDFIDSDMNPLLQVDAGGREILIPADDAFIESVDEKRREIIFSLPEGLLDL